MAQGNKIYKALALDQLCTSTQLLFFFFFASWTYKNLACVNSRAAALGSHANIDILYTTCPASKWKWNILQLNIKIFFSGVVGDQTRALSELDWRKTAARWCWKHRNPQIQTANVKNEELKEAKMHHRAVVLCGCTPSRCTESLVPLPIKKYWFGSPPREHLGFVNRLFLFFLFGYRWTE